jgi:hypothetical protein
MAEKYNLSRSASSKRQRDAEKMVAMVFSLSNAYHRRFGIGSNFP